MIVQLDPVPVHVIGASYGGAIAMSLGYRCPELVGQIVSIEGAIVKPARLPGTGMAVIV